MIEELKIRTDSFKLGFACHKHDKRILLLYITDTPNYSFPASGSRKDTAFSQALVADGIKLPARFAVSWNEGADCWVGVLCGDRVQDSLTASLQAGQTAKRGKKV